MLKRQTTGSRYHFLIFERQTEEESVLTITKLLKFSGHIVSVFISKKIYSLIEQDLKKIDIIPVVLPGDIADDLKITEKFIRENPVDLVIFTRYSANTNREHRLYKSFVKEHQVCSLIENYDRWFRKTPPIKFNGYKIIRRSILLSWKYCRDIFDDFSCYFISEIHPNSQNPFKELIRQQNNKLILDFPFKIMEQEYNPKTEYEKPIFVIPGSVSVERRDYKIVLDVFSNKEIQEKDWELILLGRPIERKGRAIIRRAQKINKQFNNNKIKYFENYIPKEKFDKLMIESTHIIAPVNPKSYKFGKDTGAIYDILKYNKIGIVNRDYFYADDLPELQAIHTYNNKIDFLKLINQIIDNNAETFDYKVLNDFFSKDIYLNSLKNTFESSFDNEDYN